MTLLGQWKTKKNKNNSCLPGENAGCDVTVAAAAAAAAAPLEDDIIATAPNPLADAERGVRGDSRSTLLAMEDTDGRLSLYGVLGITTSPKLLIAASNSSRLHTKR